MTAAEDQNEGMRLFLEEIRKMHENAHTANAVFVGAVLDNFLEKAIKARMPNLSGKLAEKLFDGYGPFSSFSAKIDTAYAMGIVDAAARNQLHIFREIRNKFAHPSGNKFATFNDPQMEGPFAKFGDCDPAVDRQMFFSVKFRELLKMMEPAIISGAAWSPKAV